MTTLTVRAHAKINLDLRVMGRRDDGFHEIATIFQPIRLHDTLTIREHATPSGLVLRCKAPGVPVDERNLVWQACTRLAQHLRRRSGADTLAIDLDKAVPVEAGLGGGSSDAAAALRALRVCWMSEWPEAEAHALLTGIAAGLGSDVPFFLEPGTARGRGRGEVLTPLPDVPRQHVVIAVPSFGVRTADAYRWIDEDRPAPRQVLDLPSAEEDWARTLGSCRNDLQAAVAARHPEIAALVEGVRATGASFAAMSGSGSAVFGLYAAADHALRAAEALAAPGRRVLVTETVSGRECRDSGAPAAAAHGPSVAG